MQYNDPPVRQTAGQLWYTLFESLLVSTHTHTLGSHLQEVASRASHIVDTYLDIEEDEELPEGVQAPGSDSLGNAAFGLPGAPVTGGGGFSF